MSDYIPITPEAKPYSYHPADVYKIVKNKFIYVDY